MSTSSIGQRLQQFSPIAHAPRMPPAIHRLPRELPPKAPLVTVNTASVRALAGDNAAQISSPALPVLAPGANLDVSA